jgi:hypothetical protein
MDPDESTWAGRESRTYGDLDRNADDHLGRRVRERRGL